MKFSLNPLLLILLITVSCSALRGDDITQLLTNIEGSVPSSHRNPIAFVENENWTRHPDFKKLRSLIAQDWEKHAAAITTIAPSDNAKTIYYKAAQVLDRDTYLKLIMATSDRMAANELHPMQFKWVVYPQSKNLREIWHEDPPGAELKKVAARVREVMANDPSTVRFMNEVISGQVAANNRNFHPDADPLPKPTPTQPPQSINTASAPTPAPAPVNPASAPAEPSPVKSSNAVWWIAGLIILAASVVFVARKKKPKA